MFYDNNKKTIQKQGEIMPVLYTHFWKNPDGIYESEGCVQGSSEAAIKELADYSDVWERVNNCTYSHTLMHDTRTDKVTVINLYNDMLDYKKNQEAESNHITDLKLSYLSDLGVHLARM